MWRLLDSDAGPLLLTYTITNADEKGPFQPAPADVREKEKMKWLGFETAEEELGERFHSSPKLLAGLNPGRKLDTVGERIIVPNVRRAAVRVASRVVVSKSKRTVIAYGAGDKELAQYPATIGGIHDPLPIGRWSITSVVHYPWFNYDPEHFWNASPKLAKAVLPPGPNNPAGVAWIGLSKEHYGIHGTPDPGHIRHGESAGCIRMTNWDVEALSHMVRRGTPIVLEE
jgi:lipoprotein-anchoring transpeptidase ErfK/SrfK